jgi:signal transduction histidine kinase
VDRAIDTLNGAIADLRQFVVGLQPEHMERGDFTSLLAALAEQVRQNHVVEVDLDLPDERVDVPAHARAELLQIVREGLSNIARHAHATTARVTVRGGDGSMRVEIADDGVGFDTASVIPRGHHGVANMRDRAAALGGRLEVGSSGRGTTIIVTVPLTGADAATIPPEEGSTGDDT